MANFIMAAATATGADVTRATDARSTGTANLHCPVAAATGRHRRRNGLATTQHHIRAMWRRLHPHLPRACLALATDCNVFGNSARRATAFPKARVIETIAVSHVISVLLSKCVERRTIGMAQIGLGSAKQQCEPKADDPKLHVCNARRQGRASYQVELSMSALPPKGDIRGRV